MPEGETTEGFRSHPTRSRLEEIAYEQGVRDANVDEHLRSHDQSIRSHEQRLNAINGSIGRSADNTQKLTETVEALDEKLDALVAAKGVQDALEVEREHQGERAEKRWLDKRTFLLGCISVAVVLLIGMGTIAVMLIAMHK